MSLRLRYYGDPVLREKAEPVEEINDEVRAIVHEMLEVLEEYDAIGLAATQVGVKLRIYVSPVDFEDEEGVLHLVEPRVYINPVFSNPSEEKVERLEACLSLPDLSVPVIRPRSITLTAMDLEGNTFTKECEGFLARNMLHEYDHLDGILTIDRLKGKRRTLMEPKLRRIKQKYK